MAGSSVLMISLMEFIRELFYPLKYSVRIYVVRACMGVSECMELMSYMHTYIHTYILTYVVVSGQTGQRGQSSPV